MAPTGLVERRARLLSLASVLRMMGNRRLALAACVATAIAVLPCAPAGAQQQPYQGAAVATADNGEVAVVWNEFAPGGVRSMKAAIGTPGATFGAPVTIAPEWDGIDVAMDGAGNAVAVWEPTRSYDCAKANCMSDSLGVFASLRPAGGSFGAPMRLAAEQHGAGASPLLAMSRSGDWVVVMRVGGRTTVVAGKGATPLSGSTDTGVIGLGVQGVALDEAGNATFATTSLAGRPAVFTRSADGSIGPLTVLDDADVSAGGFKIAVGAQGHALAVWPAGGFLRWASRPPGGSFGAPASSQLASSVAPQAIGVDAQGRSLVVLKRFIPGPPFGPIAVGPPLGVVYAARGTVQAPFGAVDTISDPSGDAGVTRFAMSGGGRAALGFSQSDARYGNRFDRVAIANAAEPFSAPLAVSRPNEYADPPDLAIDGAGRVALARTTFDGKAGRVLAASLSPAGVTGVSVVAQAPAVDLHGRASAVPRQVLRIAADGTIRPLLRCVSPGLSCRGTVHIDARPVHGRKRIHVASKAFLHKPGTSQRVTMLVSRAARRAVRRTSLKCAIVVLTQARSGTVRTSATLTLRAPVLPARASGRG
jgi:hypothetical protein